MKPTYIIAFICSLFLAGCNSEPSLQKYFVEKTENKNFIAVDVSPTILNIDPKKLTGEQQQALASFDKMNILAFRVNDSNKAELEPETNKVKEILKDEKYQQLMRFGKGKDGGSISYVGDENHIEEFVLFANQKETGFAVIRILGKDMNPTGIMTLMSVLKQSDVNLDQLKPFQEMLSKH
ncbi:MAG TPA: DUF4252 domain-containing protein [Flavobacterium sp.]|nr:DUF4252 domain-containing protein [Flavobacterium sp.]